MTDEFKAEVEYLVKKVVLGICKRMDQIEMRLGVADEKVDRTQKRLDEAVVALDEEIRIIYAVGVNTKAELEAKIGDKNEKKRTKQRKVQKEKSNTASKGYRA